MNTNILNAQHVEGYTLSQLLMIATVFFLMIAIPNSAKAEYTWVLGSYVNKITADNAVNSHSLSSVGAKLVGTKAKGLRYRAISGCYSDEAAARKDRFVMAASAGRGVWMLKSKVGCNSSLPSLSSRDMKITKHTDRPVLDFVDNDFKPKRWKSNIDGKNDVAFTADESPSLYFDSENKETCRLVVSRYVDSIENINPPENRSDYEFGVSKKMFADGKCRVAYVYKVKSND